MKKAFDQTVRDLKREVNKKVLKVPGVEQKILDATSNEPWGPHGSLLSDIAQATRNYHEYQMIMTVVWKRINDTGKNWRHVYKALIVLDYLVAHGSERVIDEIREHAYQISTLSDFQYIDSSGRDQGSNIRKKSKDLVALVNDKERIIEVREKAHANKDKFRNTSSAGGMYRPGSYSGRGGYDDDRYDGRSRDDDRNSYGKEKEWGYRDDDRNSRDGDYGRDNEERHGRDGYRDDDYRGRSRSVDEYQYGSRSRSSDRDRDRDRDNTYDDDGQYSSRGNGARGDDQSRDGRSINRHLERKFSEQNLSAPPPYEETVNESRSPVQNERDGEAATASAPRAFFPPVSFETTATDSAPRGSSPSQEHTAPAPAPAPVPTPAPAAATSTSFGNQEFEAFDEFDPRAARTTSNSSEMDLLGTLSDSLAIVPATSMGASYDADTGSGFTYTATQPTSNSTNQPFGDPFGDDSPFQAIPSSDSVPQTSASTAPFQPTQIAQPHQTNNFDFGGSFTATNFPPSTASNVQPVSVNSQFLPQELPASQQNIDILADILPPAGPLPAVASQTAFSTSTGQTAAAPHASYSAPNSQPTQPNANYYGISHPQPGSVTPGAPNMAPQTPFSSHVAHQPPSGPMTQLPGINFVQQQSSAASIVSHQSLQATNFVQQQSSAAPLVSHQSLPSSTGSLSLVPQPSKDKFETKSTVWADTLSKGLVNLNISGSKINPLADIGIDFEAMNRKEKRMGKPVAAPVTSNVAMGKAMGSGSGMGRAAANSLRPPPNPMMNPNAGMGMGMGMGGIGMGGRPAQGMGMGSGYIGMNQPMGMGNGYGSSNQPMGMGIGYGGTNQQMGMGIGMNMQMGQGFQTQPPTGPPGSTMAGGYNPMTGTGGYAPPRPYSGSYQ